MNKILTIARKEFTDTIRDRRTLLTMVVIPLLVFPLLLTVVTKLESAFMKDALTKELKVAVASSGSTAELEAWLGAKGVNVIPVNKSEVLAEGDPRGGLEAFKTKIESKEVDAGIAVATDFKSQAQGLGSGEIFLYFNSTNDGIDGRLRDLLKQYESSLLDRRLDSLGITDAAIDPINVVDMDVASKEEVLGKVAGGLLPYLFIIFCFVGCMYPAIDLFTGEKERGTIETLLTSPVQRWQVLAGKMSVIATSGLISASLAMFGLFAALKLSASLPPEFMSLVMGILNAKFILLLFLMLLPLAIFFAGILTPLAIYAKTFKEAQSTITPLNFAVIMPAVIGLLPGIELNFATALVPIMNCVLTTKEIIAGTLDPGLFLVVILSLMGLAVLAVTLSKRQFSSERNIFRGD